MEVNIRNDHVEVEGYVNAVERNSKPLNSRLGGFVERISKGAFAGAINRNSDIHVLLNHDWTRDLGSTAKGNLELSEDSIGLHARAEIYDKDVINKARNGELVGWSFGFTDNDVDTETDPDTKLPLRKVRSLNLYEVSILDKSRTTAYEGTLINVRDKQVQFYGTDMIDKVQVRDLEQKVPKEKPIDYSKAEEILSDIKGV